MSDENVSMTAMKLEKLVEVLRKSGCPSATVGQLQQDIGDGAPTNADGTIHLVHYIAWLVKRRGITNRHG